MLQSEIRVRGFMSRAPRCLWQHFCLSVSECKMLHFLLGRNLSSPSLGRSEDVKTLGKSRLQTSGSDR